MAYTKIIPIRSSLDHCVNYVFNKNKSDLFKAIGYIVNSGKTSEGHVIYQSAINCLPSSAFQDMMQTKERFGKLDGIQGYHIIQSFKPNELDSETAHALGCKFTEACFGKRYEAIIATHIDRDHLHNHIVINSVSFVDGKKFTNTFDDYYHGIREQSDALCKQYGLSVIIPEPDNRSLTYIDWLATKRGHTSWTSIIQNDIDNIIAKAPSYGAFLVMLEHQGYDIKDEKYLSVRQPGKEQFTRTFRLGHAYSKESILARLDAAYVTPTQPASVTFSPRSRKYTHPISSGLYRQYWRYLFLLGKVKKHHAPYRQSAYLKSELLKFEKYKAQFKFLIENKLTDHADIENKITEDQKSIDALKLELNKQKAVLSQKRKVFSALSDYLRYQEPNEMYLSGYSMMQEESELFLKAKNFLRGNGCLDNLDTLVKDKFDCYDRLSRFKSQISGLKSDIRKCQKVLESSTLVDKNLSSNVLERIQVKSRNRTI